MQGCSKFFLSRGHAIFLGGRTKYSTSIYHGSGRGCRRDFDPRPVSYLEHWVR